jgi:polyhydroxyalkanoate synthesis regulator phasin
MTQEQLRMQMLAGIITEGQYKSMLNEGLSRDQIIQALEDLIETGELTGAEVRVMMDDLKAYHRAWVNRQRSPEKRSESARYAAYMKTINQKIQDLYGKYGYFIAATTPEINDLKTLKSFDTTKLGPKGAEHVKKAIFWLENPEKWEKHKKEADEYRKDPKNSLFNRGSEFVPINESEGRDLYKTAGEMISQVGLFTQENADELEAEGRGNLYRFFKTPEEREQLIKISEAYPAYVAKVKTIMDELMSDPMYQVAVGDVGGGRSPKTTGETLEKAYNRSKWF